MHEGSDLSLSNKYAQAQHAMHRYQNSRELTSSTRFQDAAGRAGSEGRGLPALQGLMPDSTVHHAAAAHHSCCFHHTLPDAHTHTHADMHKP